MPQIKITEKVFSEFVDKVSAGLGQAAAAQDLGFSRDSMRAASFRLGIPMPAQKTVKQAIAERSEEIEESSQTQAYWAQQFGVSQTCIAKIFKDLDIKSKYASKTIVGIDGRSADCQRHFDSYRKILAYVAEHGGYIPDAMKELGITSNPRQVREYAKLIGFDLSHYQFAYQRLKCADEVVFNMLNALSKIPFKFGSRLVCVLS